MTTVMSFLGCAVSTNEQALALAREARATLRSITAQVCTRPEGADRFDWSHQALDELARCVTAVSEATHALAGDPDDEVADGADELVTMIVRRRNALLRQRRAGRDEDGSDDRAAGADPRDPAPSRG